MNYLGFTEIVPRYWDMPEGVDVEESPLEHIDDLKQDLVQTELSEKLLIDIGWYSFVDGTEASRVCLIKDCEWQRPVYSVLSRTWAGLAQATRLALKVHAELLEIEKYESR